MISLIGHDIIMDEVKLELHYHRDQFYILTVRVDFTEFYSVVILVLTVKYCSADAPSPSENKFIFYFLFFYSVFIFLVFL